MCCRALMPELRRAAAGARACDAGRRRVHAAGRRGHRRDGARRERARPRHHLHLPRLVAGVGAGHAVHRPRSARPSAGAGPSSAWPCSRAGGAARVARAARRRAPAGAVAGRLAQVFTHPVLMAIVAVTALQQRRAVHAVHLLRALLPAGAGRQRRRRSACCSCGSAPSAWSATCC